MAAVEWRTHILAPLAQDTAEGEGKKYSKAEKLHLPSIFHDHEQARGVPACCALRVACCMFQEAMMKHSFWLVLPSSKKQYVYDSPHKRARAPYSSSRSSARYSKADLRSRGQATHGLPCAVRSAQPWQRLIACTSLFGLSLS